jgi:hypothetical protein
MVFESGGLLGPVAFGWAPLKFSTPISKRPEELEKGRCYFTFNMSSCPFGSESLPAIGTKTL